MIFYHYRNNGYWTIGFEVSKNLHSTRNAVNFCLSLFKYSFCMEVSLG